MLSLHSCLPKPWLLSRMLMMNQLSQSPTISNFALCPTSLARAWSPVSQEALAVPVQSESPQALFKAVAQEQLPLYRCWSMLCQLLPWLAPSPVYQVKLSLLGSCWSGTSLWVWLGSSFMNSSLLSGHSPGFSIVSFVANVQCWLQYQKRERGQVLGVKASVWIIMT